MQGTFLRVSYAFYYIRWGRQEQQIPMVAAGSAGDKKEQKNYEKQQSFGNSSVVV